MKKLVELKGTDENIPSEETIDTDAILERTSLDLNPQESREILKAIHAVTQIFMAVDEFPDSTIGLAQENPDEYLLQIFEILKVWGLLESLDSQKD